MATAGELTAEELAQYRAAARQRHQVERVALARREQQAWELARRAATLLRDRFRAERVVVFGSLVHSGCFTEWSDVDIAAAGIHPRDTLRAMELVQGLSASIAVNLVDLAACSSSLRSVVDQDGIPL
jgi:uncharacterized protein